MHTLPDVAAPIGVFDSGVGGLSVLQQLLQQLAHEDLVYLADTAWAPYGERSTSDIIARSLQITRYLIEQYRIKALVVACNTATAQAVSALRQTWPDLPLIGIEPAIKPATQITRTGHIGVMATQSTVQSDKFQQLLQTWRGQCQVRVQACNGLALAIENALDGHSNSDGENVRSLCQRYIDALRPFVGDCVGNDKAIGIDTLVLGCTHYPFASSTIGQLAGPNVQLVEPGESVARHTRYVLEQAQLLRQKAMTVQLAQLVQLTLLATAHPQRLAQAAHVWLGLPLDKAVPMLVEI